MTNRISCKHTSRFSHGAIKGQKRRTTTRAHPTLHHRPRSYKKQDDLYEPCHLFYAAHMCSALISKELCYVFQPVSRTTKCFSIACASLIQKSWKASRAQSSNAFIIQLTSIHLIS